MDSTHRTAEGDKIPFGDVSDGSDPVETGGMVTNNTLGEVDGDGSIGIVGGVGTTVTPGGGAPKQGPLKNGGGWRNHPPLNFFQNRA